MFKGKRIIIVLILAILCSTQKYTWSSEYEEIKDILKTDTSSFQNSQTQKELVEKGGAIVELLITSLSDKNVNVRFNAADCLGKIGDRRAVKPLISSLKDKDQRVSVCAVIALGAIGDKNAIEPLIIQLKNEKASMRGYSAIALAKIGDSKAIEPIIAALRNEPKSSSIASSAMVFALSRLKNGITDIHQKGALKKINSDKTAFGADPEKWQKWWDENKKSLIR